MGKDIRWDHSQVTDDKIDCVYLATGPDVIRKHAAAGGFPVDRIDEVRSIIDPTTAD